MVLRCYCEYYCPDVDIFNGTCEVPDNAFCFSAVQLEYDKKLKIDKEVRTFGCVGPAEAGLMQCRSYLTQHARPKNISCCREDYCNRDLRPQLFLREELPQEADYNDYYTGACVFAVIVFIAAFFAYRYRKKLKHHIKLLNDTWCHSDLKSYHSSSDLDQYSGSGRGVLNLVRKTIGQELEFRGCVGKGRYGEVSLAVWKGTKVAVKIFASVDERAWSREREVYETTLLRHDNILNFIAADIKARDFVRLLLVTEYHERGSLRQYLMSNTLDRKELLDFASSCASGLWFLHTEIIGTNAKPAVAHRDIKSNNILVKNNGECCIADFGLAVKYNSTNHEIDIGNSTKVGTARYMAPESLNGTLNVGWFQSLVCADIYSMSLVLWEMCMRTTTTHGDGTLTVDECELPYGNVVQPDPSLDEMLDVVCIKGIRPSLPPRWLADPVLKVLAKTMQECWVGNPSARLTALRIKKQLIGLKCPNPAPPKFGDTKMAIL